MVMYSEVGWSHVTCFYCFRLPEISNNIPEQNPLLKDGVPDFSEINSKKCVERLGKSLLDFEHEVFRIEALLNAPGKKLLFYKKLTISYRQQFKNINFVCDLEFVVNNERMFLFFPIFCITWMKLYCLSISIFVKNEQPVMLSHPIVS